MIWPSGWLLRLFVRRHEEVRDQAVRRNYVRLECWTSIAGNLLLGGVKLALGLVTGSIALTADAAHTFGDMISSVVLLVSMRVAAAPPDRRHPYGHGRAEALGTLVLAMLLVVTAVEFGHPAWDRMTGWHGSSPEAIGEAAGSMGAVGWVMIPVLLAFWAFKEWMARFSSGLGRAIESDALEGDARHHRSDALATLLVIVSFVGARLGWPWLDGLCGLGVAGFILWSGASLAWGTMSRLLGEAPSDEEVSDIMAAAASVRGVRGVHGIEVHDYGHHKAASLHVEVGRGMSTEASHRVATTVEDAIRRRLLMSAVVHVEVREESGRAGASGVVEQVLRETVAVERSVVDFHAIHVTSSAQELAVDLHLTVERGLPVEECHRIEHELVERLNARLGAAKISVHCEPARTGAAGG